MAGCPLANLVPTVSTAKADARYEPQAAQSKLYDTAPSRFWTRITVTADHGLPVGVGTPRAFSVLAIALADWPASS